MYKHLDVLFRSFVSFHAALRVGETGEKDQVKAVIEYTQ